MKTLLVAINAKYSHTSLSVRTLHAYARVTFPQSEISFAEYTINQRPDAILAKLYHAKPDMIGFSCYIWNIETVCVLAREIRKLLPECFLFFGGPEVSFSFDSYLTEGLCDCVLTGEGEASLVALLHARENASSLDSVPSAAFLQEGSIVHIPQAAPICLDTLPFPYDNLSVLKNRILYYEASRGCPFQCSYCLSSREKSVRFKSLDTVLPQLQRFLDAKVRQVKFVDRTFNCRKDFCMSIWRYLAAHDNGVTNFHFEIGADLLDSECLDFLSSVRPGLFQFEIGVQSTHPQTLSAIHRSAPKDKLFDNVRALRTHTPVHLHLDLIAGLPYENYAAFRQSFNEVYELAPHQLQLGFLKVLKGSGLEREKTTFGLVHHTLPPYEVLYTDALSYEDVLRLKGIEEMTELYYNSGRYGNTLTALLQLFPSPFDFYQALSQFYFSAGYIDTPPSLTESYHILLRLASQLPSADTHRIGWHIKYDMLRHQKIGSTPEWLPTDLYSRYKEQIFAFYRDEKNIATYLPHYQGMHALQIFRLAHLEVFPFQLETGASTPTAYLFDYAHRDVLGRASVRQVMLPEM